MPLDTVYSLSGEVPTISPALEAADAVALQRGAVEIGSIRTMCLIRKIASAGAVLHVDTGVEVGRRLELELETGEQLVGTIVWHRGCEVGLRFDDPIDVLPILAKNLVSQPGERRTMPRVEVLCQALIEVDGRTELVMVRDIAQGGAKIEAAFPLSTDQRIVLTPEGLRPIEGSVRWTAGQVSGVAFSPELGWQELMPWLRSRKSIAPADFLAPPAEVRSEEITAPPSNNAVQLNLPARVREGTRRWQIDVSTLTRTGVEFECYAALRLGTMLWIVLPGLEGWPARVVGIEGYRFNCEFTQPLHPAVLERILASAGVNA